MKTYVKPEIEFERFTLNNSVASTSCEEVLDSTITTYEPQQVTCAFSGDPEYVWSSGNSGCNRVVLAIGYFENPSSATYIESTLKATVSTVATYARPGSGSDSGSSSSSLQSGYYVYLYDGEDNDCVALATPSVLNYYTHS